MPDAHTAYLEACNAPSPKASFAWSHAAVYYAGRDSDWFFLANNSERVAFPVFKTRYELLCQRVVSGETLPAPEVLALPEETTTPLSKQENQARLARLREQLDL